VQQREIVQERIAHRLPPRLLLAAAWIEQLIKIKAAGAVCAML